MKKQPNKDKTISLKTAKKWAKEWRETESTYNRYKHIHLGF